MASSWRKPNEAKKEAQCLRASADRSWCTWAAGHAQRKFVHAVKVNRDDAAASQMVMRMDALFHTGRFHRPLAPQVLAEMGEIARRKFFNRMAAVPAANRPRSLQ